MREPYYATAACGGHQSGPPGGITLLLRAASKQRTGSFAGARLRAPYALPSEPPVVSRSGCAWRRGCGAGREDVGVAAVQSAAGPGVDDDGLDFLSLCTSTRIMLRSPARGGSCPRGRATITPQGVPEFGGERTYFVAHRVGLVRPALQQPVLDESLQPGGGACWRRCPGSPGTVEAAVAVEGVVEISSVHHSPTCSTVVDSGTPGPRGLIRLATATIPSVTAKVEVSSFYLAVASRAVSGLPAQERNHMATSSANPSKTGAPWSPAHQGHRSCHRPTPRPGRAKRARHSRSRPQDIGEETFIAADLPPPTVSPRWLTEVQARLEASKSSSHPRRLRRTRRRIRGARRGRLGQGTEHELLAPSAWTRGPASPA